LDKFNIQISKSILKDLNFVEKSYFEKIKKIVNDLVYNPFPENAKKLKGKDELVLRLRVGVYRIVYLVDLNKRLIIVLGINHRKSAYRNL